MSAGPPASRVRPLDELRKGRGGADECDLSFRVELVGFRADAASGLRVGDLLPLGLVRQGAFEAVAVLMQPASAPIGSLAAFPGLARLVACMRRSNEYVARVEQLAPTRCVVAVSRLRP